MIRGTYIRTLEIREKNRSSALGVKPSAESNMKRGVAMRAIWSDPEYKRKMLPIQQRRDMTAVTKASHTPEARAKRSATMTKENKRRWADPAYKARVVKAIRTLSHPNKLEKTVARLLGTAWQFVGNGKLIIDGKCPDFQSTRQPTQLLEVFGDYWHQGEDGADRIAHFSIAGYQTAILWEQDVPRLQGVN